MFFRILNLALRETFFASRTRGHIFVGALAVTVSSVALILVSAFSEGVNRYSDYSYQKSRAIIGSLRVQLSGAGRFTPKQFEDLESRVGNDGYEAKLVSDGDSPEVNGRKMVYISRSNETLRFRIFDETGIQVDRTEADFPEAAARIGSLRKVLEPLWPNGPLLRDTKHIADEVREIVGAKISGLVPEVSWVSMPSGNDPEVRTNRHQSFPALLRQELFVASIDAASPIFREKYGFRLLWGTQLFDHPDGKLQLGVLMNTTFLAKYVIRSDDEMRMIRSGRGKHLIPKFLYFNFPAIDGTPQAFDCGSVKVKVVGLCEMDDDQNFPHLFVTEDQGQAYFYLGERWHPSYTVQFSQYLDKKPMIELPSGFQVNDYKSLPSKGRLERGEGLTIGGFTHYQRAYLHVADDHLKTPSFRAKVREELQREKILGIVEGSDVAEIRKSLDALTIPSALRRQMEQWVGDAVKRKADDDRDFLLPRKGEGTIDPDQAGSRWTITDTRLYSKWLIRDEAEKLTVTKMSPFQVQIPSDTVTSTLNRIKHVVDTYAKAIRWTVLILTMLATVLFGFAHYFRKRKDFGLLKASGMSPITLGMAFSCQVLLVCIVGFACGTLLGYIASLKLEFSAAEVVNSMAVEGEDLSNSVKFLLISWSVAWQSGILILGSALMGCIIPAFRAATVRPIEDLNTGI